LKSLQYCGISYRLEGFTQLWTSCVSKH